MTDTDEREQNLVRVYAQNRALDKFFEDNWELFRPDSYDVEGDPQDWILTGVVAVLRLRSTGIENPYTSQDAVVTNYSLSLGKTEKLGMLQTAIWLEDPRFEDAR